MARGILLLFCTLLFVGSARITAGNPGGFVVSPFRVDVWAADIQKPRGLVIDDAGDVLVVSTGAGIIALWEETSNGRVNRTVIVQNMDLNHGIALSDGWLYASTNSTVWRWRYNSSQRREATGMEMVIRNVNNDNQGLSTEGHQTRTLAIDRGILYVSVGSSSNVDPNSYRARLRSFDLGRIPLGGYDFAEGVVFADGLRNEVGLAFDSRGRLWGVENGADELERSDLGGDIHDDNPAEEMNLFDGTTGTFYGYPYCWTEYNLPSRVGHGRGTQWAWPSFINSTMNDNWCRDVRNNRPPEITMPAHTAPLGITFYNGSNCGNVVTSSTSFSSGDVNNEIQSLFSFDCAYEGDAFVALHGSWNRDTAVGYKVVRIEINDTTGLPTLPANRNVMDVFGRKEPLSQCGDGTPQSCFRPVDLKFTKQGILLVTSDASGEIIRVSQDRSNGTTSPSEPSRSCRTVVLNHYIFALAIIFSFIYNCISMRSFGKCSSIRSPLAGWTEQNELDMAVLSARGCTEFLLASSSSSVVTKFASPLRNRSRSRNWSFRERHCRLSVSIITNGRSTRARAIKKVQHPPVDYDYRGEVMAETLLIVKSEYPELIDLVEEGSLVVVKRPKDYVERRSDGYREPETVFVVGTAHMSSVSAAQVERVVQAVRPENVVVELCRSRAGIMFEDSGTNDLSSSDYGLETQGAQKAKNLLTIGGENFGAAIRRSLRLGGRSALALRLLLGRVSEKLSKSAGVATGVEFRAARRAAEETGAQLVLGDRPIEVTLKRAWEALKWDEKLRLARIFFQAMTSSNLEVSEETLQRLKSDDALSQMFAEMGSTLPSLLQPLIFERDMYLAWSLKRSKAVNGTSRVVGVVASYGIYMRIHSAGDSEKNEPVGCCSELHSVEEVLTSIRPPIPMEEAEVHSDNTLIQPMNTTGQD
ncbi:hypothetical protein R1sor_019351 [Riccia sorocarpa]|uniref:Pyrroloquinoline quinone-dependent pyranose dehydrogenase beta-propeller domain-containing protein n=1 Tax=Riccia sorocarpa TaxID=122646 RepID=A0ABD3IIG7_9MARC